MFRSLASSATALIVAASPVFAEVTPADVWENIAAYYDDLGYQLDAGSRQEEGDRLVLEDVTISASAAMTAGGGMTVTAPRVVLSQTGGGDVRTVFEGAITGKVVVPDGAEQPGGVDFTMSMPGNEMVTSGEAGDMLHQLRYPETVIDMVIHGSDGEHMPIKITSTDGTGSYRTVTGESTEISYDLEIAGTRIEMKIERGEHASDGPDEGVINVTMQDLDLTGQMNMPGGDYNFAAGMNDALRAGAAMGFDVSYGAMAGDLHLSGKDEDGQQMQVKGSFSGAGGDVTMAMNGDMLRYAGSAGQVSAAMSGGDLPFPITYEAESGDFDVQVPLLKSDTPQPFKFSYALKGLQLGEQIWAMFDPTAQLPRDPADLTIDVGGQLLVKRDLMDPELQARIADVTEPVDGADELTPEQLAELMELRQQIQPFEPKGFVIRQVALKALGAGIDISGQLAVPEGGAADEPVGELNGTFTGINALLDKLVAMGLVPGDQVMGARMMMMMFARPVEGQDDTLTTKLEFREGGSVFANGQQVK